MHKLYKTFNIGTHRKKDENGYLFVDKSPILKAGILEYYGSELIDGSDTDVVDGHQIDPEKVYKVYIPREELEKGADSFKLLPITNDHQWLGREGADAKEYQEGTSGDTVSIQDDMLFVPLKFTGDDIIDDLESGDKEELSASYTNELSWAGDKNYDFIAKNIKGNHIALVEKGRCGSDVRVLNQATVSETTTNQKGNEMSEELKSLIEKIIAIASKPDSDFEGGADEKYASLAKILEHGDTDGGSENKANNETKLIIDGKEIDLSQFFKQEEKEDAHKDTGVIESVENEDGDDDKKDDDSKVENEDVDKRALIDEIGGILKDKGIDEEIIRTIIGKAEKIAYDASETSDVDNGCKSKNEDTDDDKKEDIASRVENALAQRDSNLRRAYNMASEVLGDFNAIGMTEKEMLVRALNHLGVDDTKNATVKELTAMLKVANKMNSVDQGFSYVDGNGQDSVEINI